MAIQNNTKEEEEAGSAKGAWSNHSVLNQEFRTWLSSLPSYSSMATYRNSAMLCPILKTLPLRGLTTFSLCLIS
jgi:hypothetical protein